jgi:HlyD family secretion protein
MVKEVSQEFFEDFIVFQAKVEPLNLVITSLKAVPSKKFFCRKWCNGGTKDNRYSMYNPNTELNYLTQETAIIEQINNLNTGKLNIRNQELSLTKDLALIEHDYNDAKRVYI